MPSEQAMRAIRRNQSEHLQALTTGEGLGISTKQMAENIDREFAPLVALAGELAETLQNFMRWSEPLAEYAGSQWAEDNDLSQPCHWLNETSKEAAVLLDRAREMGIPAPAHDSENATVETRHPDTNPFTNEDRRLLEYAIEHNLGVRLAEAVQHALEAIDRSMAGEKEAKDAEVRR